VSQPTPSTKKQDSPEETATLSRELGEFLIQLSIAVHRFSMYPPGHPSLQPAAEGVVDRFEALLGERDSLALGVAQNQLIIEGVATDEKHPVLSDLAKRLHQHQLGAVVMDRGLQLWELQDGLASLAQDAEHSERPLGSLPKEEIPDWEHLHLYGVGYGQLRLKEGEGEGAGPAHPRVARATELWLGLARAAVASDDAFGAGEIPGAADVARSIGSHRREEAYDQVIVGYLMKLTAELKGKTGEEARQIRERVSQLVDQLDASTLSNLVGMGGDFAQQRQFLLNASESMAAKSVMKVLKAAAESKGQTISNSLTRLMSKLAHHSTEGGGLMRSNADSALGESVEELMADWELKDPNPDAYTLVLDEMSRAVPLAGDNYEEMDTGGISGAQRIVEMALEVDAYGPIVEKSISQAISEGHTTFLIELVREAPGDSEVAERIRGVLTNPSQLRKLLSGDSVDIEALTAIVDSMGESAYDPLLDVLAESDSRSVRRAVFDQLATRVEEVGDRVVERLDDSRWFVLRNLLALIQRFDHLPESFDAAGFLDHPDARVRREVFPLAVRQSVLRERTLASALGDPDERMVRMALAELGESVPETIIPTIVNRVVKGEHAADVRVQGIRALGRSRSTLALDTLVEMVSGGRSLLGRVRLADPTREVLAAVRALAQSWSEHPNAKPFLEQAAKSKEPEMKLAVRVGRRE